MITIPVFVLTAAIGIVLAALDSPDVTDKARAVRLSRFVVAAGAATLTVGGALVVRGWLLD